MLALWSTQYVIGVILYTDCCRCVWLFVRCACVFCAYAVRGCSVCVVLWLCVHVLCTCCVHVLWACVFFCVRCVPHSVCIVFVFAYREGHRWDGSVRERRERTRCMIVLDSSSSLPLICVMDQCSLGAAEDISPEFSSCIRFRLPEAKSLWCVETSGYQQRTTQTKLACP